MDFVSNIFWPAELPLPLLGVAKTVGYQSIITTMESNRNRYRPTAACNFQTVDASWTFLEDDYETFEEWFINTLQNGQNVFYLNCFREECPAAFLDPDYTLSRDDNQIQVSATLLIMPLEDGTRLCQSGEIRTTIDGSMREIIT